MLKGRSHIAFLLILVMSTGCGPAGWFPGWGRVIDAVSEKPIQGAIVEYGVKKSSHDRTTKGPFRRKYGSGTVETDKTGDFRFEVFLHEGEMPADIGFAIHKEGYVSILNAESRPDDRIVDMEARKSTFIWRLQPIVSQESAR